MAQTIYAGGIAGIARGQHSFPTLTSLKSPVLGVEYQLVAAILPLARGAAFGLHFFANVQRQEGLNHMDPTFVDDLSVVAKEVSASCEHGRCQSDLTCGGGSFDHILLLAVSLGL